MSQAALWPRILVHYFVGFELVEVAQNRFLSAKVSLLLLNWVAQTTVWVLEGNLRPRSAWLLILASITTVIVFLTYTQERALVKYSVSWQERYLFCFNLNKHEFNQLKSQKRDTPSNDGWQFELFNLVFQGIGNKTCSTNSALSIICILV